MTYRSPCKLGAFQVYSRLLREKSPPPKATVNQVLRQIACLGGFLAPKGDGDPGVKTIWLGLKDLQVAVKMMRAMRRLG